MMATRRREYLALVLCYVVIGAKSLQIAPGEPNCIWQQGSALKAPECGGLASGNIVFRHWRFKPQPRLVEEAVRVTTNRDRIALLRSTARSADLHSVPH